MSESPESRSSASTAPQVLEPRAADLGHGLTVRRILPHAKMRSVGPYVFLDHAGPSVFAWCEDVATAHRASAVAAAAFAEAGFGSDVFVTPIASPAAQVLA